MALEQARRRSINLFLNPPFSTNRLLQEESDSLLGILSGLARLWLRPSSGKDRDLYSEEELRNLLPCPLIKHLPLGDQTAWIDAVDLIASGPLMKLPKDSSVALIPVGNVPNDQLQAFNAELSRALTGRNLLLSTDLRETSKEKRSYWLPHQE